MWQVWICAFVNSIIRYPALYLEQKMLLNTVATLSYLLLSY